MAIPVVPERIVNKTSETVVFVFEHQKTCVKTGKCTCNKNGSPKTIHLSVGICMKDPPAEITLTEQFKKLAGEPSGLMVVFKPAKVEDKITTNNDGSANDKTLTGKTQTANRSKSKNKPTQRKRNTA